MHLSKILLQSNFWNSILQHLYNIVIVLCSNFVIIIILQIFFAYICIMSEKLFLKNEKN